MQLKNVQSVTPNFNWKKSIKRHKKWNIWIYIIFRSRKFIKYEIVIAMVIKGNCFWSIKSKYCFKEVKHALEKTNYNEIICLTRRNSKTREVHQILSISHVSLLNGILKLSILFVFSNILILDSSDHSTFIVFLVYRARLFNNIILP